MKGKTVQTEEALGVAAARHDDSDDQRSQLEEGEHAGPDEYGRPGGRCDGPEGQKGKHEGVLEEAGPGREHGARSSRVKRETYKDQEDDGRCEVALRWDPAENVEAG